MFAKENKTIKVGSRKSELALIQTRHVISLLEQIQPDCCFEIVTMNTLGDKVLDIPLPKIGEKALFTQELESALSNGQVQFVVHSLKDLPTVLPQNMAIGAVLIREDPRDALVLRQNLKEHSLQSLPKGSVIGTSSLRRTAQLARHYPDLVVESIRGNLNTRLKKLDEQEKFQALILATAGLIRMGWNDRISKILDSDELLYAVGQGALGIECRADDIETLNLLKPLFDVETALSVIAERSFLKTLEGGCSAPVAVESQLNRLENNKVNLLLTGAVWSLDGMDQLKDSARVVLEVKDDGKKNAICEQCPYRNRNKTENLCSNQVPLTKKIKHDNQERRDSKEEEIITPAKRQKITIGDSEKVINVLIDDPHPLDIPVGADFMGKCPFLEKYGEKLIENNLNDDIENCSELIMKCPFFNVQENDDIKVGVSSQIEDDGLYVGLAPHPDIPKKSLEEAVALGKRLALKLMGKGAIQIMAKAHAHIRKS